NEEPKYIVDATIVVSVWSVVFFRSKDIVEPYGIARRYKVEFEHAGIISTHAGNRIQICISGGLVVHSGKVWFRIIYSRSQGCRLCLSCCKYNSAIYGQATKYFLENAISIGRAGQNCIRNDNTISR